MPERRKRASSADEHTAAELEFDVGSDANRRRPR
jgi:hypothetical protein